MATFKPLGDRVAIKPEPADEKTAGGLYVPDTAKEKPQRGTVVAIGAGRVENGERIEMTVKEGDEVTMTVTNIEGVRDIIHGVAIPEHDVNLAVAPQDTRQVTFTADEPGVYWVYCTYFCSALHLEMRSRLIVEPRE